MDFFTHTHNTHTQHTHTHTHTHNSSLQAVAMWTIQAPSIPRSPFVLKHITSLYICMDVHMSFCTLTLTYFCISSCVRLRPKLHWTEFSGLSIITHIILENELLTTLNSFAGLLRVQLQLKNLPECSISIRVSGDGMLIRYLS